MIKLGTRFNIVQSKIPPQSGQVTILDSDQLKAGQRMTRALRFTASWIWALALLSWAGAILLVKGRRRLEVRAIAIGFVSAGFLILIVRSLGERYFVNHLVQSDSVRPAAQHAFEILTDLLKGAGWTAVIVGVVALAGVWLTGPGRRATQAGAALAPHCRRGRYLRRHDRRLPVAALVAADAAVRLLGERPDPPRAAAGRDGGCAPPVGA